MKSWLLNLSKIGRFMEGDIIKYIVKYIKYLILYTGIVTAGITYYQINNKINNFNKVLAVLDRFYDHFVDTDYYCKTIGCKYITVTTSSEKTTIDYDTNEDYEHEYEEFILDFKNNKLYLPVQGKVKDITYYVDVLGEVESNLLDAIILVFSIICAVIWFISNVLKDEKLSHIFSLRTTESDVQHELLFDIVSNINHEVNTPIMVLSSMIDDINYEKDELINTIDNYRTKCPNLVDSVDNSKCGFNKEVLEHIEEIDTSLKLGSLSIEQITGSLNSLTIFKKVRFSDKNIDIYTLIKLSLSMVNKTKISKFKEVYIDHRLKKLVIDHDTGLTHGFFVNLIINHAKNSMEANANAMAFTINYNKNNTLSLRITDNGSGIPDDLVDKVFELYATTKSSKTGERGTGLYTNKLILSKFYDGDLNIEYTKVGLGTIFSVDFKVKVNEEESV